jgi:hypothetical protein
MNRVSSPYVVTWLGGAPDDCMGCGLTYVRESETDRALHRRLHAQRVAGWRLPARLGPADPVVATVPEIMVLVEHDAPLRWRTRAEKVASLANKEVGYDFPMYHAWLRWWDDICDYQRRHKTTAVVAYDPADRLAIGLLVYELMSLLEVLTDYPDLSRSVFDPLIEYVASVGQVDDARELLGNLNKVLVHLARHPERAGGLAQVMSQAESAEAA